MKIKLFLLLMSTVIYSSTTVAQQPTREHIKCYLQIADQSRVISQFVITDQDKKQFIDDLPKRSVFMSDGKTEQQIVTVYECVELDGRFKNQNANDLEKVTPF